jgi:hypothetical protein
MKSLKITAAERKEREKKYSKGVPVSIDGGDAYPYGLRLDLNDETLEKLGMESLPKVGKAMVLTAKVKVIATRENQREDGEKCRSVEMQITDMEFGAGSAEDAVMAAVKQT